MSRKIIVIGAGIVGSTIACYLSKAGADVTVLEQASPACAASSKSFGWINANFPENKNYFDLRQASIQEHKQFQLIYGERCKPIWGGSLWWELSGNEKESHLSQLRDHNYAMHVLDTSAFKRLEPQLSRVPEKSVHFPEEGAVDSEQCTKVILDVAKHYHAQLVTGCQVDGFITQNSRCVGVETTIGQFYGDMVVIAAGVQAGELLKTVDLSLPMHNETGLVIHTQPIQPMINHLILADDISFRQQWDGSIVAADYFGGSELTEDSKSIANRVLDTLRTYLPGSTDLHLSHTTVGVRPMPQDGFSTIGESEKLNGLYIASTHSGVTLAPIIGKLATNEILSATREDLLQPFRLERFQLIG